MRPNSLWALAPALVRLWCAWECLLNRGLAAAGYRRRFFSQKGQDKWIVERVFGGRPGGFFVDIGAGDGICHSNTYVLERDFGWKGILIEANPNYVSQLRARRLSTTVNACVDGEPQDVDFLFYGYLGGIVAHDTDNSRGRRSWALDMNATHIRRLKSVSLLDVLTSSGAPRDIDYLSIDVEGAEYRVLRSFPFAEFSIKAITIERPTPLVHRLLIENGFLLAEYRLWEGFYLSRAVADELAITARPFSGAKHKLF